MGEVRPPVWLCGYNVFILFRISCEKASSFRRWSRQGVLVFWVMGTLG